MVTLRCWNLIPLSSWSKPENRPTKRQTSKNWSRSPFKPLAQFRGEPLILSTGTTSFSSTLLKTFQCSSRIEARSSRLMWSAKSLWKPSFRVCLSANSELMTNFWLRKVGTKMSRLYRVRNSRKEFKLTISSFTSVWGWAGLTGIGPSPSYPLMASSKWWLTACPKTSTSPSK